MKYSYGVLLPIQDSSYIYTLYAKYEKIEFTTILHLFTTILQVVNSLFKIVILYKPITSK